MQRNSLVAILAVLAAGLLWGTVGPAEILANSPAGPVAVGGARILSGGLVLTVIMLVRDPGAFRALPRAAWPALLAASAATAVFQGTFLTSAARTAATLSLAEPFVAAALGIGLLHERLSLPMAAGTLLLLGGLILVSVRTVPAENASRPAPRDVAEPTCRSSQSLRRSDLRESRSTLASEPSLVSLGPPPGA